MICGRMSCRRLLPRIRARIPAGILASLVLSSGSAYAQVVRVTVRDSATAKAIPRAIVTLVHGGGATSANAVTDADGFALLAVRPAGVYALTVRRLGYSPILADSLAMRQGDTLDRAIVMHEIAHFLAQVAVRAERESIRNATFSGMKIWTLGATVITPSQVDVALPGATDFTDLVSRNPSAGFSVDYERKCVMSNRGDPPMCLPVIVDGLLLSNANDAIPPEVVDYMLIVRGNEIGVLYGTIGENGAVLIFTKRGTKRGPGQGPS